MRRTSLPRERKNRLSGEALGRRMGKTEITQRLELMDGETPHPDKKDQEKQV
jgi:hypothetical protein